jgi:hypothetical protein
MRAPAAHGRFAAPAGAVGGELGPGEEEAAAGVVEISRAAVWLGHVVTVTH